MEVNRAKYSIEYERPQTSKRIFSALLDFLIFCLIFLIFFIISDQIAKVTPGYQENDLIIENVHQNSCIYVPEDGPTGKSKQYRLISDYYETNFDQYTSYYVLSTLTDSILGTNSNDGFINFMLEENYEKGLELKEDFNEFRLNIKIDGKEVYYIDETTNQISYMPKGNYETVAKEFFIPYINETCRAYLSYVNGYNDAMLFLTRIIVIIEIPIPLILSCFITYLFIPLIFNKGKKTIGKLVFKIGVVNKNLLNVSNKQYFLRFLIFLFLEVILSIFTFLIPIIISFNMIFFTKNKQCLHDYIMHFQLVDTSMYKIYNSLDEIVLDEINSKNGVDFRLR